MKPLRKCIKCGTEAYNESDLQDFAKNRKCVHRRQNVCNKCEVQRALAYNKKTRNRRQARLYGITEEHLALLESSPCAICNTVCVVSGRSRVDHDHETGKVRGPLCHKCNAGLGLFGDSSLRLALASEYLRKHGK